MQTASALCGRQIWVCLAKDNYFKIAFQSDQITYLTLQAWAEMELRLTSPPNEEREQKFQEGTHVHNFFNFLRRHFEVMCPLVVSHGRTMKTKLRAGFIVFFFFNIIIVSFPKHIIDLFMTPNDTNIIELQWLEHRWLVYQGCFELLLESL